MATKNDDDVEQLYVATAHSTVLVFTESGKVHWLKVHQIPESAPTTRGKAIVNLLQIEGDERIATTVAVREFDDRHFLVFATEQGVVKRTELSAYANPRAGGIIAISLDEGDRLLAVRETDGKGDLMLATRNGISIRFPEHQVRSMGRNTRGVRGIDLREGDLVVSLAPLGQEGEILTVSERGYGKRTRVEEYRLQGRGGLGIINLKVTAKTGAVVGARRVEDGDDLVLVTEQGKLIRTSVEGIRSIGRSTQGVRVMDLDDDDRIVAIATVAAAMLAVAQDDSSEVEIAEPESEVANPELETPSPDTGESDEE
jgi:DNA gyrase subunit A